MIEETGLEVGGVFTFEHVRDGKVIDSWEEPNTVVTQGLNYILNTALGATAKLADWYLGIFEGNYTPVAGLTAATVKAAASECVTYDEATRPAWTDAPSTTGIITNAAARAEFTMNADKTIHGAFLISTNAKDGSADSGGTLFSASRFGTSRPVLIADVLIVTYSVQAQNPV